MRTFDMTMRTLVFAFVCLVASLYAAPTYSAYVMGYFKESPNGSANSPAIHLAVSRDGLTWLPLNQNNFVVKPALGTKALRDPFFYRMPDGTFTVLGTDNWNSEYIHIWSSPDLRTFTNERLVRLNKTGMHSWAPEAFYDASKKQHAIIWSGNTDRNRLYVSYTSDFVTVTDPVVFFDPGYSVIDGHMELDVGGYNVMFYKDERNDTKLFGTRSTTLEPGSFNTNTYTTGHGAPFAYGHVEAPIVIKSVDSETWRLWGDSYIPVNANFYAWQSNDIFAKTWTRIEHVSYTAPPNAKHGTIAAITETELTNLIAKYGTPTWDLIKSFKMPNSFVKHVNRAARVAAAPSDPTGDLQWKIVPGLADPTGISFESVSLPNNYLRHANSVLGLAASENTADFKSSATFYKEKGFANDSWVSLRSHTFSDRYIRILADSTMRIDPISTTSTASEKQDATFQLVYSSVNLSAKPEERAPYSGVITIPGTVEMENYDKGGSNVAYFDSDAGNAGAVYRTDDVDIEADGAGYFVGYTANGEWLEYSVDVKKAGVYEFAARVASQGDGSRFSLWMDGKKIKDSVVVPNTGDWKTFSEVTGITSNLTAGTHVLRFMVDAPYFNIDKIRFIEQPVSIRSRTPDSHDKWPSKAPQFDLIGRRF